MSINLIARQRRPLENHPYGDLFPGGDTTGHEEAEALLKRVKIAYGPDAKTKKRSIKRQQRKKRRKN